MAEFRPGDLVKHDMTLPDSTKIFIVLDEPHMRPRPWVDKDAYGEYVTIYDGKTIEYEFTQYLKKLENDRISTRRFG